MKRRFANGFYGFVFALAALTGSPALAGLELTKEIVGNLAQVPSGQAFTYRLSYRAASTTTNFYNVVLTDLLPPELSYISAQGTAHTTNIAYSSGTRTLRVAFVNPLLAGSTGQIDLNVMFRKGSTPNGAVATNEAVITAADGPAITSTPVTIRAYATNTVVAAKSLVNPSVPLDQGVTYTVSATTPTDAGSLAMTQITMTDSLPAGSVFVTASGGGVYDPDDNTVVWSLPDIVPGTANTQSRSVTVRYPAGVFALNGKVTNVVQVTGTPLGGVPVTRFAALTNTIVAPTAGSSFTKDVDASYVYQGKPISKVYNFNSVKNTGNTPLAGVMVTDAIPSQLWVSDFYSGSYAGSPSGLGSGITVEYRTNLRDWTAAPGSPFSGSSSVRITVASLSLATGETVRDLRWSFGDLPATYQINSLKFTASILPVDRDGNAVATGQLIRNTGRMTYTDFNGPQEKTDPADITVLSPRPVLQLEKGLVTGSTVAHGAVGSFYVRLRNTVYGAEPLVNPVLADLLPPYLVIRPGTVSVYRKPAGAPDPVFEQLANYNGTGRTLLRWSWTGAAAYSLPTNDYIEIRFQALQPTGTVYGAKTNEVTLAKWDNPVLDLASTSSRTDPFDLDGDGVTAEPAYYKTFNWTVPSDASMDSQKWVQGTLNDIWTRYPEASSVPGGRADYRLTVRNSGNVPQRDVVVDDILPFIGDGGVIDLSPRDSEWRPNLAGPVQAPANVVVYYSTAPNPTRTDFVPSGPSGSTPANWSTNPPANITRVRALRFVFQNYTLQPQQSMELTWPMRVPVGAPTGNEIAWNSFGYYATRTDSGTLLLPAEPLKVGIQTVMDTNAVYGDRVWFDADKDGIQQTNEYGLNGLRVELWQDSGPQAVPDGVCDTNTDRFVGWTVTGDDQDGNAGFYLFPNLAHGDYYARFAVPDPYVVTARQAGGDPLADSDLEAATGFSPITSIEDRERDLSWDAGLWLPPYGLTLVKTAGHAGDGVVCWTNAGRPVTYFYTIVNTGSLNLVELELTDDVLGPVANLPGPLAPGASVTVTAVMSSVQADVTNVAVVLARPADSAGREISGAPQARASDDAVVRLYAAIGDLVWEDNDADGVQDSGEPGVANVTVELRDAQGQPVATTVTAPGGAYGFRDLIPGAYSLRFVPPAGYRVSPANQGANPAKDSDAEAATGETPATVLAAGENDVTWDAGIYRLAALGDYVWLDADLDGIQDAGEAAVPGVVVSLLDNAGNPLASTNTDASGLYRFDGLRPGSYAVHVAPPPGYVLTAQDKGGQDARDSDVAPATGRTVLTSLISGEEDLSWDAGLFAPAAGISIVKTAGAAADGAVLHIPGGQDVVYAYVVSNTGNTFLAPVVVTDDVLGAIGTIPGPLAPGASALLTATAYHVTSNVVNVATAAGTPSDAYGRPLPGDPVSDQDDAVVRIDVAIGDRVWLDGDRDGIQDPSEAGFPGITVILRTGAGDEVTRDVTDASGLYLFDHLPPGDYAVEFVVPSTYYASPAHQGGNDGMDSDADPVTGRTPSVTLTGGQVDRSWDAGLFRARPGVSLVKTAGSAPDGEAFIVYGSGTVVYAYAVANTGETWLCNLAVTDDVLGPIGTLPGPLAPGAGMTLTRTVTNLSAGVTNIGTVTANPCDGTGSDLPGVPDVTDSDDAVVTVLPRASLGDRVWIDADRDGIQDAGEMGLMGVSVTLLEAGGGTAAATVTDSAGRYLFEHLIPGDYRVRFDLPSARWHFTLAGEGGDEAADSDADRATGLTAAITLASGQDDMTWDAGVYGGLPPGFCESMTLGRDFNAIVFGDFTANGGDTEGRLAVGGTARFTSGYSVGTATVGEEIPAINGTADMLIAGGDLYDGYWGVNGNTVYGGTRYGPVKYTGSNTIRRVQPVTLDANGNVPDDGSGAPFALILQQLRLASAMIGAMDDRGVVTKDLDSSDNHIVFAGEDSQLNVFNVDAESWSGAGIEIDIEAPAGASVLINISGSSASLVNRAIVLTGVTKDRVLFNYTDAVEIETSGFIHEGSVLAPYANAILKGGSIDGFGFFGGSVQTDNGFEFHHFPFRGALCDAAPAYPAIDLIVTAGQAPDGAVLTATNGAVVTVRYQVTNAGDTWLEGVTVVDGERGEIGTVGYRLAPGAVAAFSAGLAVTTTDTVVRATASGQPVAADGSALPGYLPVSDADSSAIHLVDGGDGAGEDPGFEDWMRPDLAVTMIEFLHKPTLTGEVFSVRVTVENRGDLETDGGQLTVFLSAPTFVAPGTAGSASLAVGTLQPGESKVLDFLNLQAGDVPGTHHLRAFVDSQGAVSEYSDGDNQIASTYELNAIYMRIDMKPGGLELSWNSFWGQTYSIYRSTNLVAGFDLYREHIEATPPMNVLHETISGGMSFYRLEVEAP